MADTEKLSLAEAILDASIYEDEGTDPFRISIEERCDAIVDEMKEELHKTIFDFTEGHSIGQLKQAADAHRFRKASSEKTADLYVKAGDGQTASKLNYKAQKHEKARNVADKLRGKLQYAGKTHTSQLRKEETEINEIIVNSNSSGQGYDADHEKHNFHTTILRHGYHYSHSTPVRHRDGISDANGKSMAYVTNHHTYKHHSNPDKNVTVHRGVSGFDVWNTSTSGSGHRPTSGSSVEDLHKHLKTRKVTPKKKLPNDLA